MLLSRCSGIKCGARFKTLDLVARRGNAEELSLLLDEGLDTNQIDRVEQALTWAAGDGNVEVVRLLLNRCNKIKYNAKSKALNSSAKRNRVEVVKLLLDEYKVYEGGSALMAAAEGGSVEVVKLLLFEKGVCANHIGHLKRTALIFAAAGGYVEMTKLLIEEGADVDHVDDVGYTPLMFAAKNGCVEVVKILLDNGADANKVGSGGKSALIRAIQEPCSIGSINIVKILEVVKLLLDRGADVNQVDNYMNTPLIYASSRSSYVEVIKLLLDRGADYNKQNYLCQKALRVNFLPHIAKQFIIAGAFAVDDMNQIKKQMDKILDSSHQIEKITILSNLIAIVDQKDKEFIKNSLKFFYVEIKEAYITIDTKNFRLKEKIDLCEKVQMLKTKTKVTAWTKKSLKVLWNKVDNKLVTKLKVSYDKTSDIWGRYISKEKLNKELAQKIVSYFENDNELENLCKAVPYKYALEILKSIPQKDAVAIQTQINKELADSSTVILGLEGVEEEISV